MLIGLDEYGRTISIHSTQDESGPLFASHIHDSQGRTQWGILNRTRDCFRVSGSFPDHASIWPFPDYRYDDEAKRRRIYSAAVHHAILMGTA